MTTLLGPKSPLRALRHQRRLVKDKLVVLVPVDGYYAQKECCRALLALGHTVVEVVLGERGEVGPLSDNLGKILTAVVQHRPDLLVSINYVGFDRINCLSEALEAMGLPTAIWFVDHPMVLATGWLPPSPNVTSFFVWDRSFVKAFKTLGAERIFHLPLGTDVDIFSPKQAHKNRTMPLGFVGHSLMILDAKWRRELTDDEQHTAAQMAERLMQDRATLHDLVPNSSMGPPIDRSAMVLAFACIIASKRYRLALLRALPQKKLHVTGDNHWAELLPRARCYPSTDYGAQSADIYRNTVINVNATNLQMPSTVNQRVFDVPATGNFLATDAQPEVFDFFDVGHDKEMFVYRSSQELVDGCAFYQKHETSREKMVARARERVLGAHTYTHRLRSLVQTMREHHASLPQGTVQQAAAPL